MRLFVHRVEVSGPGRMLSGKQWAILGVVLVLAGAPLAWPRAETLALVGAAPSRAGSLMPRRNDGRLAQRGV